MMKNVLKDTKFNTYYFYEEQGLFLFDYKPSTEFMSQEEFKSFVEELKELTTQKKPRFMVDYSVHRLYIVEPEMQEWTVQQLGPAWIGFGLEKYCQILAKDLVSNLSGQQTVQEAHKIPNMFETKFFEHMDDALAWFGVSVAVNI
ncbi:hypothetical protein BKI52_37960 [marine bacterium AO1-C]|nr:hypothetical protein BKI52_37960 [marine bacterium AO1-C]